MPPPYEHHLVTHSAPSQHHTGTHTHTDRCTDSITCYACMYNQQTFTSFLVCWLLPVTSWHDLSSVFFYVPSCPLRCFAGTHSMLTDLTVWCFATWDRYVVPFTYRLLLSFFSGAVLELVCIPHTECNLDEFIPSKKDWSIKKTIFTSND